MNSILHKIFLPLLCLTCCLFLSSAFGASFYDNTIYLGVLAKDGKATCFEQWSPTAKYLQQKMISHKTYILCLDFDEIEEAVAGNRVDFTITNPSVYVELEYKYGVSRIATMKNSSPRASASQFGGVIFHRADRTDIKNLSDLKGKKFMAVAENSFGGWQVAWRHMQERGIIPHRYFKELSFGGRHDAVVMAVAQGTVDAGSVRTDTLERMAWEQKIHIDDFTVIDRQENEESFSFLRTTRLYPEWPLAKMRNTDQEVAKQVALAMMQMPAYSDAARASRSDGWTIPLDYHEVHECLRMLKIAPYADYGLITLKQLYEQYKTYIGTGLLILFFLLTGVVLITKLNRKLASTLSILDGEHRQNVQIVANLNEFKLTLDQTLDCVYMFDSSSLKYTYVNQGAINEVGYSREELLTMTPLNIKPDVTEEEFRKMLAPLLAKDGTSLTYVAVHQHKDTTLIPVEVFLQHITPPQKQGRFVAIVRDITERIAQDKEKELLQSRLSQEQKLASVGQLAAGLAHELNTPTQYISSNIDFLKDGFTDITRLIDQFHLLLASTQDNATSQDLVKTIEKVLEEVDWLYLKDEIPQAIDQSNDGVKQISSIILAMKNFALTGSTEKVATDLNELITATLTVSRNEWKYLAEPVLQLDSLMPPVSCLPDEIAQVFLNIIVNAVHAIADRQEAEADDRPGKISIATRHQSSCVIITISDNGCGINTKNLTRIFDPFFTTKEVGRGIGQGLAICYDTITNKHDGLLEVTSQEGAGTTFTITLNTDKTKKGE